VSSSARGLVRSKIRVCALILERKKAWRVTTVAGGASIEGIPHTGNGSNDEEIALRETIEQTKIVHSRLNYWMVTEGIFFAAIATYTGLIRDSEVDSSWLVLYALSGTALVITCLWETVIMRADAVQNWYSARLHALHWRRHSYHFPEYSFDVETDIVFPWKHPQSFWSGDGLNILIGSYWMSGVFAAVWVGSMIVAAMQLNDCWLSTVLTLIASLLLILYTVYLIVSRVRSKRRGRDERVRLREQLRRMGIQLPPE